MWRILCSYWSGFECFSVEMALLYQRGKPTLFALCVFVSQGQRLHSHGQGYPKQWQKYTIDGESDFRAAFIICS